MPKYTCSCGNTINISNIPNEEEYLFISDVEYDNFVGIIDSEELYRKYHHFLLCSRCKNILIFWNGFNNKPDEYIKRKNLKIDIDVEKAVFLFNASEGNYGIYDLVWELGRYKDVEIEEKYRITKDIIEEICESNLGYIQLYHDYTFKEKGDVVKKEELDDFLNNPANWNPNSMPLPCLEITEIGSQFLEMQMKERDREIRERLFKSRKEDT